MSDNNNNLKVITNPSTKELQLVEGPKGTSCPMGFLKVINESGGTLTLRVQALAGSTAVSGEQATVVSGPGGSVFVGLDDTVDGVQIDLWVEDEGAGRWQSLALPSGFVPQLLYRRFDISIDDDGTITVDLWGRSSIYLSTGALAELVARLGSFAGTLEVSTDGTNPRTWTFDFGQSPPTAPLTLAGIPVDATTLTLQAGGAAVEVSVANMDQSTVTVTQGGSSEPTVVTPDVDSSTYTIEIDDTANPQQEVNLWFLRSNQTAPPGSPVPAGQTGTVTVSNGQGYGWWLDFELEDVMTGQESPDPKIIVKRPPSTLTDPS